jgi:hypothetical protein
MAKRFYFATSQLTTDKRNDSERSVRSGTVALGANCAAGLSNSSILGLIDQMNDLQQAYRPKRFAAGPASTDATNAPIRALMPHRRIGALSPIAAEDEGGPIVRRQAT